MQIIERLTVLTLTHCSREAGTGIKGAGDGGRGGGGWGKRGWGMEILGSGVVPKFVAFY